MLFISVPVLFLHTLTSSSLAQYRTQIIYLPVRGSGLLLTSPSSPCPSLAGLPPSLFTPDPPVPVLPSPSPVPRGRRITARALQTSH